MVNDAASAADAADDPVDELVAACLERPPAELAAAVAEAVRVALGARVEEEAGGVHAGGAHHHHPAD